MRRACSARVPATSGGGWAPGVTIRTPARPGTAARIWASMREASGQTAPGDPVSSKVTIRSSTLITRSAAPRAMTEGRMLRSSAAAT